MKEAETLPANSTPGKEKLSHFLQVVPFNWLKSSHIKRPFLMCIQSVFFEILVDGRTCF